MSKFTDFLNLFMWDSIEDSEEEFNIDKALNDNWKKIDTKVKTHVTSVNEEINNFKEEINYVKNFCMKAKYLVINSDIEINCSILKEIKTNIITYGLNHKSTVTLSSITDESVLIFVQREFENMENKAIEVGEYNIKIQKENRTNIHEIMLAFILNNLNNIKIMDENETK